MGPKTTQFGGNFGAAGPAAGPSGEQFGGRRKAAQYTSSARFGVKFGAHGRFGEQSGAAGILAGWFGVQPDGPNCSPDRSALAERAVCLLVRYNPAKFLAAHGPFGEQFGAAELAADRKLGLRKQ